MKSTINFLLIIVSVGLWVVPVSAHEIKSLEDLHFQERGAWFTHEYAFQFEMSDDGRYFALMTTTLFHLFEIATDLSAPTLIIEQPFDSPIELEYRSTFDYPRITFSPGGQWVAASFPDDDWVQHTVRVWDTDSGELVAELTGDFYVVTALVFRPSTNILAIGHQFGIDSWMGGITFYDVRQQRKLYTERPSGAITELAYNANGTLIMTSTGNGTGSDMSVHFAESGGYVGSVLGCPCSLSPTWRHIIAHENPDGEHPVLVNFLGDYLRLTSVQNPLRGRDKFVWSNDGNLVVIEGGDSKVMVVDVRSGLQRAIGVGAMQTYVQDLRFHPHRSILAFNNVNNQVALWDVEANTEIATLAGSDADCYDLEFSPDGTKLAVTRRDAVRIWDVETGELFYLIKDRVRSTRFSPGGHFIFTLGRQMQVWRLPEEYIP